MSYFCKFYYTIAEKQRRCLCLWKPQMYYPNYFPVSFRCSYMYNIAHTLIQSPSIQLKTWTAPNWIKETTSCENWRFLPLYLLSGKDSFVILSAFLQWRLYLSLSAFPAGSGEHSLLLSSPPSSQYNHHSLIKKNSPQNKGFLLPLSLQVHSY